MNQLMSVKKVLRSLVANQLGQTTNKISQEVIDETTYHILNRLITEVESFRYANPTCNGSGSAREYMLVNVIDQSWDVIDPYYHTPDNRDTIDNIIDIIYGSTIVNISSTPCPMELLELDSFEDEAVETELPGSVSDWM